MRFSIALEPAIAWASSAVLPEEGVAIALNPQMIRDEEINQVSKAVLSAITTFARQ